MLDTEEGRMRRKILLQEDKLAKIEITNKMRRLELQERFEEKEKLELEVSDLEKRKVDYKLRLQRAESGHSVDIPDISKSVSFRLKIIFIENAS